MADIELVIKIPEETYKNIQSENFWLDSGLTLSNAYDFIKNGTSLNDLLQRLRKRISDLYNTDVTYDNGDYNTMDTPTLDKVLEYFDSGVKE